MMNPSYKGRALLPMPVIEAARAGDAEAVERVMARPPMRRIQNVSVALCCAAVILRAFFVKVQRRAGGGGTWKG